MEQLLIAGIAVILIGLLIMLFSRSQSLQRFAVLELVLVLMVTLVVLGGIAQVEGYSREQFLSQRALGLQDVQDYVRDVEVEFTEVSDRTFKNIESDLDALLKKRLPTVEGEESTYLSQAVYERKGEKEGTLRVFRKNGKEGLSRQESIDYIQKYGAEAIRLGQVIYEKTDGNTGVMIYSGSKVISPKYLCLTEVSLAPQQAYMEQIKRTYWIYGGIFLLIGTLLLAIIIAWQGRQLNRLLRRMVRVAEGKEEWTFLEKKSDTLWLESNEMRGLKNCFRQIVSDMARTNYLQYRILQGYFRFAPKQIEKIFGKESILEVDVNDRVQVTGTLAFVACPEQNRMGEREYLKKMNREYEELDAKKEEYGGILLSGNSELTSLRMLFREETRKAMHFGIDVAMSREKGQLDQFFVLLHRTSFIYGIAGNEEQAFPYLISKEMKMLEKYVERFRLAGIRMAVTDSVYELIEKETAGRYIGYLESEGLTFKVYEILDAYPALERQNRINTKEKFEQALNLFYQEDYYLGRNLFTEVLKECPDDEVAKWYLFLCEECLNAEHGKGISGALFSD